MIDSDRLITIYALVGSVFGAALIGTISSRGDLLRAGARVG
ncbi:MAG: hypothetical protein R3C68_06420 [Myxococcota bacterium]